MGPSDTCPLQTGGSRRWSRIQEDIAGALRLAEESRAALSGSQEFCTRAESFLYAGLQSAEMIGRFAIGACDSGHIRCDAIQALFKEESPSAKTVLLSSRPRGEGRAQKTIGITVAICV